MKKPCLILLLSFISLAAAGMGEFQFSHLTTRDGLSDNRIRCVLKDSRGYVWSGTENGLNRYDGTRVKSWRKEDYGLASDYIFTVEEDRKGNIWLGTARGIACYDRSKDTFFVPPMQDGTKMDDIVSSFAVSDDGKVWFATENSSLLCSYDYATGVISERKIPGENFGKAKYLNVAGHDRIVLTVARSGLWLYDVKKKEWCEIKMISEEDNNNLLRCSETPPVTSLISGDHLYLSSHKGGLFEFDILRKDLRHLSSFNESQRPVCMACDSGGYLWVGTTQGLVRFGINTGEQTVINKAERGICSLSEDYIVGLSTKGDEVWVGTKHSGLNRLRRGNVFKGYYSLNDGTSLEGCIVNDISEAADGTVWMATENKGLLKFNPRTGDLKRFNNPQIPDFLFSVCADGSKIWISSQEGISRLDTEDDTFTQVYRHGESNDRTPRSLSLFKTNGGVIVASCGPVLFYDGGKFSPLLDDGKEIRAGSGRFAEDRDGLLWQSSYIRGEYALNLHKKKIVHHFSSDNSVVPEMTSSTMVDSRNNVWIIAQRPEIIRYDKDSGEFTVFDHKNVPSFPSGTFQCAEEGADRELWIATSAGLLRFNPETKSCYTYTRSDGLFEDSFSSASCRLRDGSLMFGTISGVVVFSAESIQEALPSVDIVSFSVGSQYRHLGQNVNDVRDISLSSKENSFGFEVATPSASFGIPVKYRLLGYDSASNSLPANNSIYYYNVPPGSYKLKIEGHKDITITIIAPFFQTPKGIALLVAIIVVIILGVFAYISKRRQKKLAEEEKERLIKEKLGFLSGFVALEQFNINSREAQFLQKLDSVVTRHLSDENFSVKQLEEELSMSHTTLNRRVAAVLNTTPIEYIKTKRLAVAHNLLKQRGLSVQEVSWRVGFGSPSYFSQCFKAAYGKSPTEI